MNNPPLNYDELSAHQALEIINLKAEIEAYKQAMRDINLIIYGIGGPLNDNKHGYKGAQFYPFQQIANIARYE